MDSKLVFPAALLVLFCLIETGLAQEEEGSGLVDITETSDRVGSSTIKCHQCNSYKDQHCDDPFHHPDDPDKKPKVDTFLAECPENMVDPFCRKIYQNVRGDERIIRSCAQVPDDRQDRTCYTTVLEEYNTIVCDCSNEDGCNSGNTFKVSSLAVLSAVLLAYLIH